jgi:hypothetical protein
MNLKAFDMLVLPRPDGEVKRLQASDHPPTVDEIRSIQRMHRHLWNLEVFVDTDLLPISADFPLSMKVAAALQGEIGPNNEVPEFMHVPVISLGKWEREQELNRDLHDVCPQNVSHTDYVKLLAMRTRSRDKEARQADLRDQLMKWGYKCRS